MRENLEPQPFDLLIFGGTGDLAMRKLLPSLFKAHEAQTLHPDGKIWGISRQALSQDDYRNLANQQARQFITDIEKVDEEVWQDFCKRLDYIQLDAKNAEDFKKLAEKIPPQCPRVTISYLATSPNLFEDICRGLDAVGLNHACARVVLEKPLGTDLESNIAINESIANYFDESQIFRIDHYQGKESVQNLLMMRFANIWFEPLWRREWISHVQITIAESVGIEGRGAFYDHIGALRDMVQNHIIQLICSIAMEAPSSMDADAIRDEKLKVINSLKPFSETDVSLYTVRGQYKSGVIDGKKVKGFHEEDNIAPNSQTETFVAIKTEIENWRWAGVPFFLRTGKRMQERLAEIVIQFRDVPHQLFPRVAGNYAPNQLVIRLQPEDSMTLHLFAKRLGNNMVARPASLNLDFFKAFEGRRTSAYERLLLDAIDGDQTLFVRRDEQEAAWRWVAPIMKVWDESEEPPKQYTAGTWGPASASALLARDGVVWHEEQ